MTRTRRSKAVLLPLLLAGCATGEAGDPAPATAAAQEAGASTGGVHRFRIGALEAASLFDGGMTAPNDGKTIWRDPDAATIGRVLAAAGLPADQVRLDINVLMVRVGDRVLLVDSGYGQANPNAGKLVESLRAAGLTPESVTDIAISHGHGDHVGGLTAFPNARVHMAAAEWEAVQSNPRNAALVAVVGTRVNAFQPGATLLPGVTSVPVRGHTPGHMAYQIESRGQRLLAIGDSAHHYVVSVREPEFTINFDGDAPTAEASRRALFGRASSERLRLFAPHFPAPGLGTVVKEGDGFRWVAGR